MPRTKRAEAAHSKRMSFLFGGDTISRIDEIRDLTEATTYAEVIRNALLLYEDYVKSPAEGFAYYKRRIDEDNRPVILQRVAAAR